MRVFVGAVAIGAAGCAQVLGIDDTTGTPPRATLELSRVSIASAITAAPLDLGTSQPTFYSSAAQPIGAALDAPGRWSAIASGAASVVYTAPDLPAPFQHDLPVGGDVRANFIAFEHPGAQPAPASSLMVSVTLPSAYAAGQTFEIDAIGAWTRHVLAAGELPAIGALAIASTIPYASFAATTASAPARIATTDQVVVLRYSGATLTGALIVTPFAQSDTSDPITGTMTAVVAATPFTGTIAPTDVATRHAGLRPASTGVQLGWRLDAAPGYAVGATAGVELLSGPIATTDTQIASSFTNPFDSLGWKPMLSYVTTSTRTFAIAGNNVTLGAQLAMIVDPAATATLDLPAALPVAISVAATPLTSDGMTVAIDPAQAIAIDLATDAATSTWFDATVVELAVVGTTTSRTPVIAIEGPAPHLVLPPGVLVRGHTYAIVATCTTGGYTSAASGDLQTFALPVSIGQATSGVFTLAP